MDRVREKLDWFKAVILPSEAALRARLRRILPASHDLDDMVAEVLARAYAAESWHGVSNGRAFLFTIARNLVIDNARRDKIVSFETIADLDLLQADASAETQIIARDALCQVEKIVESLPPQCRRVFVLRRVYEKSMAEIAEELALSVSTVEKHLAKAVMLVMRAWSEREDTDLCSGKFDGTIGTGRNRARGRAPCRAAQP